MKKKEEPVLGKLVKAGTLRKGRYGRKASIANLKVGEAKGDANKKMKALAIFLESNGTRPMEEIAELVGTSLTTLYKWRRDDVWDEQTQSYQKQFREELLKKVHEGITEDQKDLIKDKTDQQLLTVINELVGPNVSTVVSEFLARLHKEDFKDLGMLNRAIRRKLEIDEKAQAIEDPKLRKLLSLSVKEVGELVTAKINIIKGVRLILGQTTENVGGKGGAGNDEADVVHLLASPEVVESLKLLQRAEVIDAEFEVQPEKETK